MTERPVDVGVVLDYYHPYVSGLTEVARIVAEGLVARGHRVEVVCGRHEQDLPTVETINGVIVRRCPVRATIGKALVQPTFPIEVARLARRSRQLHLHLPLPEGLAAAAWGGAPHVVIYHCDPDFGQGLGARLLNGTIDASTRRVLKRAAVVVVTSEDYLASSRIVGSVNSPVVAIPPPIEPGPLGQPTFRRSDGPHVGFLGRFVAEKGIDVLLDAVAAIDRLDFRVLLAGDYSNIAGGSVIDRVRSAVADDDRVELLGFVPDDRLADFFASLDVFVLPSVNSFEAFGITQVQAMMAGVPVVASDLPGVRIPVQTIGIGSVSPPGDAVALAKAIEIQLSNKPSEQEHSASRALAIEKFGVEGVLDRYEALLDEYGTPSPSQ